jgi:lipoate-protein ligase B
MQFWSLTGLTSYEDARQLQLKLVDARASGEIEDTVLFLEHEPVVTRGRGLQWTGVARERHMPMAPLPAEMAFSESERGGDLTYHGPGQLVIYPICKLDGNGFGPKQDVAGFLRKLERIFIEELASHGLKADARESATGVWVGDRKIASIGIAVRKWVTYHGVAINCVNDLSPFQLISPCGFQPEVMTSLANYVRPGDDWRVKLEQSLASRFSGLQSAQVRPISKLPPRIPQPA